MKLNPSFSSAARRISSRSNFIPRKWDLFRPLGRKSKRFFKQNFPTSVKNHRFLPPSPQGEGIWTIHHPKTIKYRFDGFEVLWHSEEHFKIWSALCLYLVFAVNFLHIFPWGLVHTAFEYIAKIALRGKSAFKGNLSQGIFRGHQ